MKRWILIAALSVSTLGAACPAQQDRVEDRITTDSERADLRIGGTASMADGHVRVTLVGIERAGSWANVELRVDVGSDTTIERVVIARNGEFSRALVFGGYVVVVEGFPGVDSARVVVAEEAAGS